MNLRINPVLYGYANTMNSILDLITCKVNIYIYIKIDLARLGWWWVNMRECPLLCRIITYLPF